MSTKLFREMDNRSRIALAARMGCEPGDFARETLTVVTQADPGSEGDRFVALAANWGTGTVFSMVPELLPWAEANTPEIHYRSMHFPYLAGIVEEAKRLGIGDTARFPQLNFLLAEVPPPGSLKRAVPVRRVDGDEMEQLRATKQFHNALDDPPGPEYALAAFNQHGEAIAVAGVWHYKNSEMVEIGVDVVRGQRGVGLAPAVVIAATEAILDEGLVPFYSCSPTNVRSHRTALTCGYLPAFAMAGVHRVKPEEKLA